MQHPVPVQGTGLVEAAGVCIKPDRNVTEVCDGQPGRRGRDRD